MSSRLQMPRPHAITLDPAERRTKSEFLKDTDINEIMKKYRQTGFLPPQNQQAYYGDFSNVKDYSDAIASVQSAQDAFDSLPAALRSEFDNDPGALLKFADNATDEELRTLGLIEEAPYVAPPIPTSPTDDTPLPVPPPAPQDPPEDP